ncbi:MAG: hypothetical protein JXI33_09450 [Candidatus Aminicenantes bacterium]|nr:hypothetical protein [Candidatus Aminicenantes bacterium]
MKNVTCLRKAVSWPLALLLVMVAATFWGCSAPIPYRLTPMAGDNVGEVNAAVCVENDSISVKVLASTYGSGLGLVGGLIDSGVNSKRKKEAIEMIAPLKDKTKDINFRDALRDALLPILKELSWPQVADLKTKSKSALITLAEVNERSHLEIHSTYQLSPTAEVLEIATGFALYPKRGTKAIVVGNVRYSSERIGKFEENDEAIALWAENDAAAYRQALTLGVEETVKMLKLALPYAGGKSQLPLANEVRTMKIRIKHGRGDYGIKQPGTTITGWIVEENDQRMIFQSQSGSFVSFPKSDIINPNKK